MDRIPDRSLTVAEAKERLRETAEETMPSGYVRRHPIAVLAIAFAAGYLLAKSPLTRGIVTSTMLKAL
jgi:hypothetical protein